MPDSHDVHELSAALEAIIFVAGEPVSRSDLFKIMVRMSGQGDAFPKERYDAALELVRNRWRSNGTPQGFELMEIGGGLVFRSSPKYAHALQAMREQRPMRLSKPALETLAIVAYRQPATKPEIDHIRGVDCGGTLKLLLARDLVRIVGKREEPGRPLLYGTSTRFLSLFNLDSLKVLPTLQEFEELSMSSREELAEFDGIDLDELKEGAPGLHVEQNEDVEALESAMGNLQRTSHATTEALGAEGITITEEAAPAG